MSAPEPDTPLDEARAWLRAKLTEGASCPCCTQFAKVYQRPLSSVGTRAVIILWRVHGSEPGHLPSLLAKHAPAIAHQGGYAVLGAHWGLIEEVGDLRDDGGRAGWWRVTDLGRSWIHGEITVPKYARLYNSRCLGVTGPPVSVHDRLGSGFRLDDLLAGKAA